MYELAWGTQLCMETNKATYTHLNILQQISFLHFSSGYQIIVKKL